MLCRRYCLCVVDGQTIGGMQAIQRAMHSLVKAGQLPRPGIAVIPYHMFTDVDVPGRVWVSPL